MHNGVVLTVCVQVTVFVVVVFVNARAYLVLVLVTWGRVVVTEKTAVPL